MNNSVKTIEERLIALGGQVWDKRGRRIYISKIWKKMFDVTIEYYKTGNIKSFSLNGEEWSNNQAGKLSSVCDVAYYDCELQKFVLPKSSYLPKSYNYYIEEILNKF